MPEAWVRREWRAYAANAENRLDILCDRFDVSFAALQVRIKELRLAAAGR